MKRRADCRLCHGARTPIHGGSIRVYAERRGCSQPKSSVQSLIDAERQAGVERGAYAELIERSHRFRQLAA